MLSIVIVQWWNAPGVRPWLARFALIASCFKRAHSALDKGPWLVIPKAPVLGQGQGQAVPGGHLLKPPPDQVVQGPMGSGAARSRH